MRRFTLLRLAVKFLRRYQHPLVQEALLDNVLRTMGPKTCANAVFTALKLNPDPSYWHFTRKGNHA